MKTKTPLPSLWGCSQGISRKIIILFTIMILSLSTLFLPYPISSLYTTSYAIAAIPTDSAIVLQVREKQHIDNVIENYIIELKNQNYQNVSFEIKEQKLKQVVSLVGVQISQILSAFDFYADYIILTNEDNEEYVFKTKEESNLFIDNINQYVQTSYEIQEKVKREIGSETKEDELEAAIAAAKKTAEEIERRKTATYIITDTSDISSLPLVQFAIQFNGNPYVYGGTSLTNGADCSGFVQSVFANFGISLPRTATSQAYVGSAVSIEDIQPGDLVFYTNGTGIDHVGIYIGGAKIIHASKPSTGIMISSVNIMTKVCVRRVL